MKIYAPANELAAACRVAMTIVPRKPPAAIFGHILVSAADGKVFFTGCDFGHAARGTATASVTIAGDICAPAELLLSALKSFGKSAVTLTAVSGELRMESEAGLTVLHTLRADTFPERDAPRPEHEVTSPSNALSACAAFVGSELLGPVQASVHLAPGYAVAASASGGCLVGLEGWAGRATIPGKSMDFLSKPLKADGRLFVGDRRWHVERENALFWGRLAKTEDVARWPAMLAPRPAWLALDADALIEAAEGACLGNAPRLTLQKHSNVLAVNGEGWGGGGALGERTIACEGGPGFFICGSDVLARSLAPFKGKKIQLGLEGHALSVTCEGGPQVVCMAQRDHRMLAA